MWSRTPSTSQPPPTGPAFLTSHLRRASANSHPSRDTSNPPTTNNNPTSPPSTSTSTSSSTSRPGHKPSASTASVRSSTGGAGAKGRRGGEVGVVGGGGVAESEEDDAWADGSDDEAAVTRLRHQTSKIGLGLPSTASKSASGSEAGPSSSRSHRPSSSQSQTSTSPPPSSGWSLFSIIPGASRSNPTTPQTSSFGDKPPPLPTAVPCPPPVPTPAAAGAACDDRGDDDGGADEGEGEAHGKGKERRGSSYQIEQWKKQIKSNISQLVADPTSLLATLADPPPPDPLPTPTSADNEDPLTSSLSIPPPSPSPNRTPAESDSDDEDDPAAGYVQLDARALGSGAQEVVEFLREEDPEEQGERGRELRRRRKFAECLGEDNVDLAELRKLAWAGIPPVLRPMAWQLLLGYLPAPASRRAPTLARKRQEYADAVRLAFARGKQGLDGPIWHQISIDVPRTRPGVRLWQGAAAQRALERVLYVWAIRHPASGYVQGINDLVTPFFQVFLGSYIDGEPEDYDVAALPPAVLEALEADCFWCLSKLLDGIQDNYIFAQPGIQRQVARMKSLCSRVDAPLAAHLEEQGVEFIQFAFRWMNCLLMRELSVKNIVRMWDTYLAEGSDAFSEFHLYVCLAFLIKWSDQLRQMDFQSIIMFLQSLPTQDWTDANTELLLSEAFMWSRTFLAR